MNRKNRKADETRLIKITHPFITTNRSSVLIEAERTRILCSASVEERVPMFLKGASSGWITAEYAMIPGSAGKERILRERQKLNGRVTEIERFISRGLRMCIDLKALGERTIIADCDVLEADGSTRCVAFNGALLAVLFALKEMVFEQKIAEMPEFKILSAISCGIIAGEIYVDLNYEEDKYAEIDLNLISSPEKEIAQVIALGEDKVIDYPQFVKMVETALKANMTVQNVLKKALQEEGFET